VGTKIVVEWPKNNPNFYDTRVFIYNSLRKTFQLYKYENYGLIIMLSNGFHAKTGTQNVV
jgi:hypothetical protein